MSYHDNNRTSAPSCWSVEDAPSWVSNIQLNCQVTIQMSLSNSLRKHNFMCELGRLASFANSWSLNALRRSAMWTAVSPTLDKLKMLMTKWLYVWLKGLWTCSSRPMLSTVRMPQTHLLGVTCRYGQLHMIYSILYQ